MLVLYLYHLRSSQNIKNIINRWAGTMINPWQDYNMTPLKMQSLSPCYNTQSFYSILWLIYLWSAIARPLLFKLMGTFILDRHTIIWSCFDRTVIIEHCHDIQILTASFCSWNKNESLRAYFYFCIEQLSKFSFLHAQFVPQDPGWNKRWICWRLHCCPVHCQQDTVRKLFNEPTINR